MGMDKSGSQSFPGSSTTKVTGWVERSGFPGTVISNNELVVSGPGNITVQASITLSGSSVSDTVHIYKNGVSVASASGEFSSTKAVSWSNANVNPGDTIAFYYQNASGFTRSTSSAFIYFTINT
jgi:hypothetical protein